MHDRRFHHIRIASFDFHMGSLTMNNFLYLKWVCGEKDWIQGWINRKTPVYVNISMKKRLAGKLSTQSFQPQKVIRTVTGYMLCSFYSLTTALHYDIHLLL